MPTPNRSLRLIREQRGLSVRELASRAGLSAAQVSRIENGHRAGSRKAIALLADVLSVDEALLSTQREAS